jgi:hypothetical protein
MAVGFEYRDVLKGTFDARQLARETKALTPVWVQRLIQPGISHDILQSWRMGASVMAPMPQLKKFFCFFLFTKRSAYFS